MTINLENLLQMAAMILLILIPLGAIRWLFLKNKGGIIHCRRCGHVGKAKIAPAAFRGYTYVCSNCRSEDWVKVG